MSAYEFEESNFSDTDSIQEAIMRSLSDTSHNGYYESDQDSSVIYDLTNNNTTNGLEDDIYAFFVEAGLEDPEELNKLGIDIGTIRAQKELEERIKQKSSRDEEITKGLKEQYEHEDSLVRSESFSVNAPLTHESLTDASITRDESFVTQSSLKRELDNIVQQNQKKMRLEEYPYDDLEEANVIDLTMEEENTPADDNVEDYLSNVPWNVYNPNTLSFTAKQKQKAFASKSRPVFKFEPRSSMPFIGNFSFPKRPYVSGSGGSSSSRYLPSFIQEDHIGAISRQITESPFVPEIRSTYITSEEAEKELRELLENITDDDLPPPEDRTGTPDRMSINLLEHQKIGLQWMVKMEKSTNKGGILADDMGLGKTIQAMAVICANEWVDAAPITSTISMRSTERIQIKATLIVCPVSLIDQWRREIETKTEPKLKVLVYHGNRTRNPQDFVQYDVIISSYSVVASDCCEECKGPLSKVNLHRVILDEAHTIKNRGTKAAKGSRGVEASFRWCMTATPIQNKVEELYSLISFLRIRPFCIWEEFRDAICKPMKSRKPEKGIKVAQVLMRAVALRRSKKAMIDGRPILDLPERNIYMDFIDFSNDERIHYDFVNERAQARFTKYLNANMVMKNYSSVLVLLLRLRQACLHPSLTTEDGDLNMSPQSDQASLCMDADVVRRLLQEKDTLKEIECPICMDTAQDAQIIQCGHILCKECFDSYWNNSDGSAKRCPQCRRPIERQKVVGILPFLKTHAPELATEEPVEQEIKNIAEMISSAKIDRMLHILLETAHKTDNKDKTIVFSQFTAMLDLIEKPMQSNGIKYLRYDGSMNINQRAEAVKIFFDDPTMTVLLVSTKCGSLGLNLTCANRVILLDVWWNPAIENQAIDRVHRIGQSKAVEVHRIFVKNTVEDRILQLQNKKQAIADGVLGEGEAAAVGRLNLNELIYLFRGSQVPQS